MKSSLHSPSYSWQAMVASERKDTTESCHGHGECIPLGTTKSFGTVVSTMGGRSTKQDDVEVPTCGLMIAFYFMLLSVSYIEYVTML